MEIRKVAPLAFIDIVPATRTARRQTNLQQSVAHSLALQIGEFPLFACDALEDELRFTNSPVTKLLSRLARRNSGAPDTAVRQTLADLALAPVQITDAGMTLLLHAAGTRRHDRAERSPSSSPRVVDMRIHARSMLDTTREQLDAASLLMQLYSARLAHNSRVLSRRSIKTKV